MARLAHCHCCTLGYTVSRRLKVLRCVQGWMRQLRAASCVIGTRRIRWRNLLCRLSGGAVMSIRPMTDLSRARFPENYIILQTITMIPTIEPSYALE